MKFVPTLLRGMLLFVGLYVLFVVGILIAASIFYKPFNVDPESESGKILDGLRMEDNKVNIKNRTELEEASAPS